MSGQICGYALHSAQQTQGQGGKETGYWRAMQSRSRRLLRRAASGSSQDSVRCVFLHARAGSCDESETEHLVAMTSRSITVLRWPSVSYEMRSLEVRTEWQRLVSADRCGDDVSEVDCVRCGRRERGR